VSPFCLPHEQELKDRRAVPMIPKIIIPNNVFFMILKFVRQK
jgi:hypothetical protein